MPERVIIIGAGGHGKVIADIVIKSGDTLVGFLDDNVKGERVLGFPILGDIACSSGYKDSAVFVVGIGDNRTRKRITEDHDLNWHTAIHPSAQIGMDVHIGKGTVIMANAVVNTGAWIGNGVIINTVAVVEHDCVIGDYAHISPGAVLCGGVKIEECVWIGAGVQIKNGLTICSEAIIGTGAAVISNITDKGTYTGIPAKRG